MDVKMIQNLNNFVIYEIMFKKNACVYCYFPSDKMWIIKV